MSRPIDRLPLAPLEDRAQAIANMPRHGHGCHHRNDGPDDCFSAALFAELVGYTQRTICRWKAAQSIPVAEADRAATRLGTTTWNLWPDEWTDRVGAETPPPNGPRHDATRTPG